MLVKMYKSKFQPSKQFHTNLTLYSVYEDHAVNPNNPVLFNTDDFLCFKNLCEDNFPFMDYIVGSLAYDFTNFSEEEKALGLSLMKEYSEEKAPVQFALKLNKKGLCSFYYEDEVGDFSNPEYIWM